jgi:hypothetical protein
MDNEIDNEIYNEIYPDENVKNKLKNSNINNSHNESLEYYNYLNDMNEFMLDVKDIITEHAHYYGYPIFDKSNKTSLEKIKSLQKFIEQNTSKNTIEKIKY